MTRSSLMTVLAVILAMSAGCAQAGALVGFDDLIMPPYSYQQIGGDRYMAQGMLLSTVNGWIGLHNELDGITNTSPNYCFAWNGFTYSEIIVDFVVPGTTTPGLTDICTFYVTDFTGENEEQGTWTALIRGVNGIVLDSVSGTGSNVPVAFSRANKDITQMMFIPSSDKEGIDTLAHCEVVPVPEPASLSVLAIGALGLIIRRRR